MKRRLVAAVACRNQGSRLYGKPLQNLDVRTGIRIIDNILACLKSIRVIDEVILGISEGVENDVFKELATTKGIRYVLGDQIDVLSRLIQCGELGDATDIFRVTSESPFLFFDPVDDLWGRHQDEESDATMMGDVVDGCGFEILSMGALKTAHAEGDSRHRSELCSLYIRENPGRFKFTPTAAPFELIRPDLRLTVDNPEDLVVCRRVYQAFKQSAPRISVKEIVKFLDANPGLIAMVAPYTEPARSAPPPRA